MASQEELALEVEEALGWVFHLYSHARTIDQHPQLGWVITMCQKVVPGEKALNLRHQRPLPENMCFKCLLAASSLGTG